MGSFNGVCAITSLPIQWGDLIKVCFVIPIHNMERKDVIYLTIPYNAVYDDYGRAMYSDQGYNHAKKFLREIVYELPKGLSHCHDPAITKKSSIHEFMNCAIEDRLCVSSSDKQPFWQRIQSILDANGKKFRAHPYNLEENLHKVILIPEENADSSNIGSLFNDDLHSYGWGKQIIVESKQIKSDKIFKVKMLYMHKAAWDFCANLGKSEVRSLAFDLEEDSNMVAFLNNKYQFMKRLTDAVYEPHVGGYVYQNQDTIDLALETYYVNVAMRAVLQRHYDFSFFGHQLVYYKALNDFADMTKDIVAEVQNRNV